MSEGQPAANASSEADSSFFLHGSPPKPGNRLLTGRNLATALAHTVARDIFPHVIPLPVNAESIVIRKIAVRQQEKDGGAKNLPIC
jgi:hypothetical protein